MRARLAIPSAGINVDRHEILLTDKTPNFLVSSPKGTVPVVVTHDEVIEESLDIMRWALDLADPEGWLKMPDAGYDWISRNDSKFKEAIDHIKYFVRYPNLDLQIERETATEILHDLNIQVGNSPWMFGENCSLADMAILPFVRQFANIDNNWFDAQGWQNLDLWLTAFLKSNRFNSIMTKYNKWTSEDPVISFPSSP